MLPGDRRKFGRVDLDVTAFAFGTAPIGNIFTEIDEATSEGMFEHAWNAGVRYFDTAPYYGNGLSEPVSYTHLHCHSRVRCRNSAPRRSRRARTCHPTSLHRFP